jgi:hypothetical protein
MRPGLYTPGVGAQPGSVVEARRSGIPEEMRNVVVIAFALSALGCSGVAAVGGPPHRPEAGRRASREATPEGDRDAGGARELVPRVVLAPEGAPEVVVRVEVARTPAQTQRGLQWRHRLAADAGMLFLFTRPRQLSFWMRDTFIPLDIVFITSERTVLGVVENAEPETDDPREVEGVSQFVLEVNAGFARAHGIGPGTVVRFEDVADVPPPAPPLREDEEDDEDADVLGGWEE